MELSLIGKNGEKSPFSQKGKGHYDPVVTVKVRSDVDGKFTEEIPFVFDSGSHITIISWIEANRLGLELSGNVWKPIEITGIDGKIPALRRIVQLKLFDFPPVAIPFHVSKYVPNDWRILGLEGIIEAFCIIIYDYHTYVFLREDIIEQPS